MEISMMVSRSARKKERQKEELYSITLFIARLDSWIITVILLIVSEKIRGTKRT